MAALNTIHEHTELVVYFSLVALSKQVYEMQKDRSPFLSALFLTANKLAFDIYEVFSCEGSLAVSHPNSMRDTCVLH